MTEKTEQVEVEIAVFHLVRKANPLSFFLEFIDSYFQHSPGVEHHLVIIFKGFDGSIDTIFFETLQDIDYSYIEVSDDGVDITAYLKASIIYADRFRFHFFSNSHTRIMHKDWLSLLHKKIQVAGVGIVGSTGSWESLRGDAKMHEMLKAAVKSIVRKILSTDSFSNKMLAIYDVTAHLFFLASIPVFPNPHIRTNAFIISSKFFSRFQQANIRSKRDSYKFESGKSGLTAKIVAEGLKIVIVGRDGEQFSPSQWDKSGIYLQDDQSNLLIEDNVTRKYARLHNADRQYLVDRAWSASSDYKFEKTWLRQINRRHYANNIIRQQNKLKKIPLAYKRVLIYGAGDLFDYFFFWIETHAPNVFIVGVCDTYAKGSKHGFIINSQSYPASHATVFDYVLISSNQFYEEIKEILLAQGIDESIII